MIKIRFISLILILSFKLNAQTVEPAQGVGKNYLQIELETTYTKQSENNETLRSFSIPSALFRYGLSKKIELQLNTPIIKEELYEDDHLIHSLNKFDNIQFGLSYNLINEKKVIPQTALMLRTIIPTYNTCWPNLGYVLALNFSNTLSNKLSLNYNLGLAKECERNATGYYVVNLNYNVNSDFHCFVENFGDFTTSNFISHNINVGFGFNLKENMVIDFSYKKGINHDLNSVGFIFTYNFYLIKTY
jgi:hypothetical protein